jgi:NitT/TauT family transport system permease protein
VWVPASAGTTLVGVAAMTTVTSSAATPRIRWRTLLDRVLVLVLIVVLWQAGSLWFGTYWLSSPWLTTTRFVEQTLNGELLRHAGYTLAEAGAGTLIGGLPAVLLPFWLRRHPIIVAILDPFMIGGYGAPKLAFAPLFLLWFGIGMESKIALTASVVFFIVYFATLAGVRALDPRLVQMAQIAGASERQIAHHIVMPAAVPNIFAGFRIAVPYTIGAAVIAELISSNRGLGYLVQTGAMNFDTTSVFAAIVAATLLVHAANLLMNTLEALLMRWRPPLQSMMES